MIHDNDLQSCLKNLTEEISLPGKQADGSYTRLPCSAEYMHSAEILKNLMIKRGLDTTIDSVGNVKGYLPGKNPSFGTIYTGSHLDTVQNGGLFDGALGIASALLCLDMLQQNHISLQHNLEIIGFQGEEGSDLGGTFGSRSMMGLMSSVSPEYEAVLTSYGLSATKVKDAAISTFPGDCYLELHIEQGKVLESNHQDIGIVTGIVGITRYKITLHGESNHAGTTPMNLRRDALTAAAELITYINESAAQRTDHLVATIGQLSVFPGSVAVIPGKVEMVLEVRHMDQNVIDTFVDEAIAYSQKMNTMSVDWQELVKKPSVHCSADLRKVLEQCCTEQHLSYQDIPSGAGHDGNAIGQRMPIGMLFVPSHNGLSHCKEEWTEWQDALKGALVLYHAILKLDTVKGEI